MQMDLVHGLFYIGNICCENEVRHGKMDDYAKRSGKLAWELLPRSFAALTSLFPDVES